LLLFVVIVTTRVSTLVTRRVGCMCGTSLINLVEVSSITGSKTTVATAVSRVASSSRSPSDAITVATVVNCSVQGKH